MLQGGVLVSLGSPWNPLGVPLDVLANITGQRDVWASLLTPNPSKTQRQLSGRKWMDAQQMRKVQKQWIELSTHLLFGLGYTRT